jgi:alkanesulfonate monooxygenase SsuD/methylene tetrahydromethanopterin reductase-like flavin-dependent oxidoreductase (luciferase family)
MPGLDHEILRRAAVADDYLAALRALFEGDGEYHGSFVSFPPLIFEPKPLQRPMPVYIGSGAGQASLRRIAQFGQGWTPIGRSAEVVEAALPRLRDLLAAIGATSVSVDFGIRSSPVIDDALAAMQHFAETVMTQAADL